MAHALPDTLHKEVIVSPVQMPNLQFQKMAPVLMVGSRKETIV